jgi:hypothetical protein
MRAPYVVSVVLVQLTAVVQAKTQVFVLCVLVGEVKAEPPAA